MDDVITPVFGKRKDPATREAAMLTATEGNDGQDMNPGGVLEKVDETVVPMFTPKRQYADTPAAAAKSSLGRLYGELALVEDQVKIFLVLVDQQSAFIQRCLEVIKSRDETIAKLRKELSL